MSPRRAGFPGLLLCLVSIAPLAAQDAYLHGTPAIEQALARLNVTGSVLMIAAHPDDENNAVLAYLSRGRHLRTAYLSATRGEGGQNLIGPEQGDMLGIIRTQELLQARNVDGAGQFFTRAIDFGFSKSADESLRKWGREEILSDMVRVIRRFRPDVIVLTFSGTPRDGHGQHQASAILGREAFAAAGDPARFPEQLKQLKPWKPLRVVQSLYDRSMGTGSGKDWLAVDAGQYDPILGRSYGEIGGISRSMHRCQAEGSPQRRGTLKYFLVPVAGPQAQHDLMDGVDLTWNRFPGGESVGKLVAEAAADFRPEHPEAIVPLLLKARALASAIDPARVSEFDEAIALCAGLWVDAQSDRPDAVPGSELTVAVNLLNRSPLRVAVEHAELRGMWHAELPRPAGPLPFNRIEKMEFRGAVPPGEALTQPYWLVEPRDGDRYRVPDPALIGNPENPPVASATVRLAVEGGEIQLSRPVHYRYVDRAQGERVRPLAIVPPVAVILPEDMALFPSARPRRIQVAVRGNVKGAAGELRLEMDSGWKAEPAAKSFSVGEAGEQQDLEFLVTPPADAVSGRLKAVAAYDGHTIARGMHVISYPHFPLQTLFPPAEAKLVRADVKVTSRRIGYIMGAGDLMPEALRQMGCEVTLLSRSDLEQRNLSEFDAIVAGVRAYNVRPELRANQPRLMDYVRDGGTYVVQYATADPNLPPLGPYPFTVSRERVNVEDAPVRITDPADPLLHRPNKIGPQDFAGWVQERGLYFASKWDPHYRALLESNDPGEPPRAGGLLVTSYGKGVYIYTGYSWFRELPAGVPGAFRIFANLLSAKVP